MSLLSFKAVHILAAEHIAPVGRLSHMPLISKLNQVRPQGEVAVARPDAGSLEKLAVVADAGEGHARGVEAGSNLPRTSTYWRCQ
jgi:hypothetical protein